MSEISIHETEPGRYVVNGPLQFDTVSQARKLSVDLMVPETPLVLDLRGVTRADSAGLALLVEWLREARRRRIDVHFENIPAQLLAIARVSRLDSILA